MADHPILLVFISLIAAVVTPCYVTGWNSDFVAARHSDPKLAKLQLWLLSVSVQAATWAVCAVLLVTVFHRGWTEYDGPKVRILIEAVLSAIALLSLLMAYGKKATSNSGIPPRELGGLTLTRSAPFSLFGVLIAGAAVAGMFFVRLELLARRAQIEQGDVVTYLHLQSQVNDYLFIATLILSLGILGSAILRTAVNAEKGADYFPPEYVIGYGATFTLLLAIAYIPVAVTFLHVGWEIVDRKMMSVPNTSPAELVAWFDITNKLQEGLNLKLTASTVIGPIAALLPVIIGWTSTLLGERPGKA